MVPQWRARPAAEGGGGKLEARGPVSFEDVPSLPRVDTSLLTGRLESILPTTTPK